MVLAPIWIISAIVPYRHQKNSVGSNGIGTHSLYNAGAMLYQMICEATQLGAGPKMKIKVSCQLSTCRVFFFVLVLRDILPFQRKRVSALSMNKLLRACTPFLNYTGSRSQPKVRNNKCMASFSVYFLEEVQGCCTGESICFLSMWLGFNFQPRRLMWVEFAEFTRRTGGSVG